jgi:hypothetical protein
MAKIGRNEPCPCGSGKKYKQCCLAKDEAAARAAEPVTAPPPRLNLADIFQGSDDHAEQLTEASNAVVDMIHAGDLDAAEQAAHDLLVRFPEVHDGYDRLGMVYEARGDRRRAADYYRMVIAFIRDHPDQYDPDFKAEFQAMVDQLDPPGTQATKE